MRRALLLALVLVVAACGQGSAPTSAAPTRIGAAASASAAGLVPPIPTLRPTPTPEPASTPSLSRGGSKTDLAAHGEVALTATALPTCPAETEHFPSGYTAYHTYAGLCRALVAAAKAHPTITRLFSIGRSYQGRQIWAMEISSHIGDGTHPTGHSWVGAAALRRSAPFNAASSFPAWSRPYARGRRRGDAQRRVAAAGPYQVAIGRSSIDVAYSQS